MDKDFIVLILNSADHQKYKETCILFLSYCANKGLKNTNNYGTPSWVLKDVTTDLNYKNGYLSRYGIPKSYYEYINNKK